MGHLGTGIIIQPIVSFLQHVALAKSFSKMEPAYQVDTTQVGFQMGRYQNGELFLKHSRLIQSLIIKMANFFGVIKMANFRVIKIANFFYQNGELFFIKMATFVLRLFSKWQIFRFSH